MATMDADAVLVDTNVLVYAVDSASAHSAQARGCLMGLRNAGKRLYVSGQVVREFCGALSRQDWLPTAPTVQTVAACARSLLTDFEVVHGNDSTLRLLLDMVEQHAIRGKQVHDANLVATMRTHSIGTLLTNNPDDFKRYAGFISVLAMQ